jgi:hypothetical protein
MEEIQLRMVEDATSGGDAWRRLWQIVEPRLWALVARPRFASHLAHTQPARRRIVDAIRAAIGPTQLRRFLATRRINPRLGFERWLRTVAKRIGFGFAASARYGRQVQT